MTEQQPLSKSSLTASQIADLRQAAKRMKGAERRAFLAEMTLKYCAGHARRAEQVFGWNRHTITVGLGEQRTGIICLGAQSAYGGDKRWEERQPEAAAVLCELAEAHAQQDPTFRSTIAYTRLTAKAALAALRERGFTDSQLPAPSTMGKILNRLGYRLRKVLKAKPQKKLKETDAIFDNVKKKTSRRLNTVASSA